MPVILYFASIVLTGVLSGCLALYAWRQPRVPGSRAYAGLALGECLLALAEILSMLSATPGQALFWFQVRFPFLAVIPIFWLVFALEYTGRKDWLSKRLLAGLFIIPVFTQVLLWSNTLHGLWVRQEVGLHPNGPFWVAETATRIPGIGFMAHSLYGLILLLVGNGLLLVTAWRMRRQHYWQALVLAGAGFTAFVFALNSIFNLVPQREFNLFTPGLGLSVFLIALAVFRFQFLKHAPAADAVSPALQAESLRSLAMFLLIFIMMAAGISAVGYVSYLDYEQEFRHQVESNLASIAALKVGELDDWREGRLADAQLLYRNPAFSALVERCLENPSDTLAPAALQSWLDRYQVYRQYNRVFLLDARGVERLSAPPVPEPAEAHLTEQVTAVLSEGQVTFLDFHRDTADGPIYLALLVPIYAEPDGSRPLGILVLRIDPRVYLYPFIQEWPVASSSAETLLVRRDGTDVLFLNDLKFQANAALNLRIPLENTQVLAVQTVIGTEGVVEGVDYRDVPSIGVVRGVPDSPWFLVARVDTAEVYAPLRERLWQTVVFFGALIAVSGAALGLVWRQQRVRYYRGQVESAQALRESEDKFKYVFEHSTVGKSITLPSGEISVNKALCDMLGYSQAELEHHRWQDITHPDDVGLTQSVMDSILSGEKDSTRFNKRYIHKSGAVVWMDVSTSLRRDKEGKPLYFMTAISDITERKQREAEILAAHAELERLLGEADQSRLVLLSVVEDQRAAEEALHRRLAELQALHTVSTALRNAQTRDQALPILLDETLVALETDAGAVWLYHPDSDELRIAVARGWFGQLDQMAMKPGEGVAGRVFSSGQAYLSTEFARDPLARPLLAGKIPAGWGGVCLPIRTGAITVGVLFVSLPPPCQITPEQVKLLESLTEMGGVTLHRMSLYEETVRQLDRLEALHSIDRAISASTDLRMTLDLLLEHVKIQLNADATSVLLLNSHSQRLEYAAGRGFRTRGVQSMHLRVGEGFAGRAALERRTVRAGDLAQIQASPRFAALWAGEGFAGYYGVPLIAKGVVKGVLEVYHRAPFHPEPEWSSFLETLAEQAAIAIESGQLFETLQRSTVDLALAYDATIEGWSRALDLRDRETEGHTQRVAEVTLQLAKAMGLGKAEFVHIRRGALLHDIGKMGVPDSILLKPGPLTDDEWQVMRRHPQLAYDLLAPVGYLQPALDIPYCHHEKWDGTGYPRGLKGEEIPLAARLFAVVDVWDALRSDRPYRKAWAEDKVLAHIRSLVGTHFDPQVVQVFLKVDRALDAEIQLDVERHMQRNG